MDRPIDVMVTPDGLHVLVAADFSSSLAVFDRDPNTGALSFKESFKDGVAGVNGLGGASAVWTAFWPLAEAEDTRVYGFLLNYLVQKIE